MRLFGSASCLVRWPVCCFCRPVAEVIKKQKKAEITPYILNLHLKYSFIDNFEDGLARVMMKTKTESGRETGVFGCIDEKGHEVIPLYLRVGIYRARWCVGFPERGGQQALCLSRRYAAGVPDARRSRAAGGLLQWPGESA